MLEHVPDFFEQQEKKCEDWAFDNLRDDEFRCPGCNEWKPLAEATMASPNPYSLPYCEKCEPREPIEL